MHIANTDLGTLFPLALGTATGNRRWAEGPSAVFDAFLDLGGNVIDTARVYSALSKSEEAIGKWFRESGKRRRVILVSKGGHPPLFPFPRMHHPRLGAKEMRKDLEASLRALGTDCIDIYLYHRDDPKKPAAALAETMQTFVKEGKIRYFGVSNWTLPRIRELQAYCARTGYRGPVMNQALFNAASDRMNPPGDDTMAVMDPEMQAWHREIAGTPRDVLAAGYMGNCGGFFQQYLSGGDRKVREKAFLTDGNRKAAAEIAAAAEKKGRTVTQEVLDFYTTVPFPCMALFAPRDTAGLAEVMEVFR